MAKTVTFESKYGAYSLVRYPKVQTPSPTGIGYQTTHRGLSYQFQPVPSPKAESGFVGLLTVKAGQDKLDTDHDGWLRDGEDQGKVRDAADALMAHREFGRDFWLQGHDPGTIYPRPQEWRQDVIRASAALDDEKLMTMIAEEKASHGRIDLLEEAQEALDIVAAVIAESEAEKAAQPSPKAPAKA